MPIADLSGKVIIITGANSGIGLEAARALADMGAQIVLACRDESKGEEARKEIIKSTGNLNVELEILDCGSFASVRAFLGRWEKRISRRVNILINNAGGLSSSVALTEDGHEQTYQTNHLSHVLLTHGLLNKGCMDPNGRIISVSSSGYYMSDPLNRNNSDNGDILARFKSQVGAKFSSSEMWLLYFRSKMAQVVWSMALQRRLSRMEGWKGITVHSCHPGIVRTSIWSRPTGNGGMFDTIAKLLEFQVATCGISNREGAINVVWLSIAPEPVTPGMEGLLWACAKWMWVKTWTLDLQLQDELWDIWCKETDAPLL